MSKLRFVVLALVACVAVGSVAIAVAKPHHHHHHHHKVKKVKTRVGIAYANGQAPTTYNPYQPYDPYNPNGTNATFSGKVKANKGCDRRRKVTVTRVGETSSSKDGQFSFTYQGANAPAGNYRVKVTGKSFTRGHGKHKRKFKCKPTTKTLTIVSS
jgi:ABC-type oligopeptide transport system substrate-binding subunit